MSGEFVRAIGWLSADHVFPTGELPSEFIACLGKFATLGGGQREIGWPSELGKHTCELCKAFSSAGEIAVPTAGALYVAPNMISHYVQTHRYAPPAEFIDAVMASPLPGTDEYRIAVTPFRRLYWAQVEKERVRQEETRIDTAADWIVRHGGDDDAVQRWKRMFWHSPTFPPKMFGSLAATLERMDELEKQFFDRVRERVEVIKRIAGGA